MLALIYLGLAIALGDLICRRFYRFVSIPHRWAAAILVGILVSAWFVYLVGLAFAHTPEPLLFADIVFFAITSGALLWVSRKAPTVSRIPARAPGSPKWDWIRLAALCAAASVLMFGTLCVNKQGMLRLCGKETSDLAQQLIIAQSVALGHNFPTDFPEYASQPTQFLFFFKPAIWNFSD